VRGVPEEDAIRRARAALRGAGDEEAARILKRAVILFPGKSRSWYLRVVARCLIGVERLAPYAWRVPGVKSLGDRYPYYTVVLTRKGWYCDCYSRSYGWRRSAETCTHVAAVRVLMSMEAELR